MNDRMNDREIGRSFERLFAIIERLRSPEGCPWDRQQTPQSMRNYLVEEAFECIEAIDALVGHTTGHEGETARPIAEANATTDVAEELGDVFLVVSMISYMITEHSTWTVSAIVDMLIEKLINRHPHIFTPSDSLLTADEVKLQWDAIKRTHKKRETKHEGILADANRVSAPMERAYRLQQAASSVGFDWRSVDEVIEKIREETEETITALNDDDNDNDDTAASALENEVGDLMFSVINLSRFLGINPSIALHRASKKFVRRFEAVERGMADLGLPIDSEHFVEMEAEWQSAKRTE